MNRIYIVIKKELLCIKGTLAFHIIAILSPLLFLLVFGGSLRQDVSFPLGIDIQSKNSSFGQSLFDFKNPSGVPYYEIQNSTSGSSITYAARINVDNDINGSITQELYSINTNMTKNYRNRLTGALFFHESLLLSSRAITINETSLFPREPNWLEFFAVSILAFGMLLSGLLFGGLSITSESPQGNIFKLSRINPIFILLGKTAAGIIKMFVAVSVYILFTWLLTPILISSFLSILPILLPVMILVLTLGFSLGMLFGETITVFIITLVSSIILWITGGGFGTSAAVTDFMQKIAELNPVSSFLRLLQHYVFGGSYYFQDLLFLILSALSFFLLSYILYVFFNYRPSGSQRRWK